MSFSNISIAELRQSLREKGLSSKGSRQQLLSRLTQVYGIQRQVQQSNEIKYRVTLVKQGHASQACMMLVAPSTKALQQLLSKATNKFRFKCKRLFVHSTAQELTQINITQVLRDDLKLVATNGSGYEITTSTGSPRLDQSTNSTEFQSLQLQLQSNAELTPTTAPPSTTRSVETESLKLDSLDLNSDTGYKLELSQSKRNSHVLLLQSHDSQVDSSESNVTAVPAWLSQQHLHSTINTPIDSPMQMRETPGKTLQSQTQLYSSQSEASSYSHSPTSLSNSPPIQPSRPGITSTPDPLPLGTGRRSHLSSSSSVYSQHDAELSESELRLEISCLRRLLKQHESGQCDKRIKSLQAQVKQLTKSEELLRSQVHDLTSHKNHYMQFESHYVELRSQLDNHQAANEKLKTANERLKFKQTRLTEQVSHLKQLQHDLADKTKQCSALQRQVEQLQGQHIATSTQTELQFLLQIYSRGLGAVHATLTAQLDAARRAALEKVNCKICFAQAIDTLLQPCSHFVACHECARKCQRCPVCLRTIEERKRVYTP